VPHDAADAGANAGAAGGGRRPDPAPMIPELFHIGSLSISPFGLMMVLAFVAGYLHLRWSFSRLGVGDEEDASAIVLAAGIGGVVGAKIYYAILYRDWHLLFDRSGLVWYGGLILGTAAVAWTIRKRRLPAWEVLDAAGPGMALGYGIGRIGCFLVGDDYGMPTGLPWGVKIPYGLPGPTTAGFMRSEYGAEIPAGVAGNELIAVHPTQLYETLAGLMIWGVGVAMIRKGRRAGTTFFVTISLLLTERFLVEFLRAKDDRFFAGFTMAQALSAGLLVVVLLVAWWRRQRHLEET